MSAKGAPDAGTGSNARQTACTGTLSAIVEGEDVETQPEAP